MLPEQLSDLEEILGYKFRNPILLVEAVTHSSYKGDGKSQSDNERLEFLGDAVIELIVSEGLYSFFTGLDEGRLTKIRSGIVNRKSLGKIAKELGFGKYILLGEGEIKSSGRKNKTILSNMFEAVIGAIFLDSDYNTTRVIVEKILLSDFSMFDISEPVEKFKNRLQEVVQKKFHIVPKYVVKEMSGPDHNLTFIVDVFLMDQFYGEGKGKSKKKAEEEAAKMAFTRLKEQNFEL